MCGLMHRWFRLTKTFHRQLCSRDAPVQNIEGKWVPVVRTWDKSVAQRFRDFESRAARSFVLSMFPYPSGKLHLGHLRVYTVADVLYRYQSMAGYAVLQPMGWDAFGLPAENAAIDRDILPQTWTKDNIESMRAQMESTMLLGLDWSREISTCDPDYYRWTQWIFLQLYKRNLAYYRWAFVNWDPIDQTVLADELVDKDGKSWRSGARVIRKPLRQWYLRVSAFSQSLLDGLKEIENNQWRDVVNMQRGWIGQLDGTQMELDIVSLHPNQSALCVRGERIAVFTRQPGLAVADLISHVEVHRGSVYFDEQFRKPEHQRGLNSTRKLMLCTHPVLDRNGHSTFRLDVLSSTAASCWPEELSVQAVHPFTGRPIPMIRIPKSDLSETAAFPNRLCFNLQGQDGYDVKTLLRLPQSSTQFRHVDRPDKPVDPMSVTMDALDSHIFITTVDQLDGLPVSTSNSIAMDLLKQADRGGYWSNDARTDWLVSRQRYWGTPIPLVHCPHCGVVPVPESELPVVLPELQHPLKRGDVPLKDNVEWRTTSCPNCGQPATRETDTLDTFVDSSWYYLRYLDPKNKLTLCDASKAAESLPVNIYVGGIEHGIRHLYYARFIAHFLHSLGLIPCREPFLRFLPVGLVLGQTFQNPRSGQYLPRSEVIEKANSKGQPCWTERDTGAQVNMFWDKMSKSKFNGVDPTEVVARHGVEVVRLMMLANVGPHRSRKWQEDGVLQGVLNWQSRLCKLLDNAVDYRESHPDRVPLFGVNDPLWNDSGRFRTVHERIVRRVDFYYKETFVLSSAIARLQELTDLLRKTSHTAGGPGLSSCSYLRALADLIVMLTPLAPLLSCELWSRLQLAVPSQDVVRRAFHTVGSTQPESINQLLDSWPYDLTAVVLEQPFPVPSEQWSEALEKDVRLSSTA